MQLQMLQNNDSFCPFNYGLTFTNSYVKYLVFREENFRNVNIFFSDKTYVEIYIVREILFWILGPQDIFLFIFASS